MNPTLSVADSTCTLRHVVGALLVGNTNVATTRLKVDDNGKVLHVHEVESLIPNNIESTECVLDALEGKVELVVIDDVVLAILVNLHLLHALDEVLTSEDVSMVIFCKFCKLEL